MAKLFPKCNSKRDVKVIKWQIKSMRLRFFFPSLKELGNGYRRVLVRRRSAIWNGGAFTCACKCEVLFVGVLVANVHNAESAKESRRGIEKAGRTYGSVE